MYCKLICAFVLLAETFLGYGMVYDIPRELHDCVDARRNKTESNTGNPYTPLEEDIHVQCLQEFLWKTDRVSWSSFNITPQEMAYVNSLIPSLVRPRRGKKKKRTTTGFRTKRTNRQTTPKTGFRIRREYRRLSDRERNAFHDAINTLKSNGTYDSFAKIHQGIFVQSVHNGANFFSWHRVFLALFEESLRLINPDVSLPYFDSTMDNDMDNPIFSNIWSAAFLGNGDGFVTTGPFANWTTPFGRLRRNIGGMGRLITKENIAAILTCCYTQEISEPTARPGYSLESAHGGTHSWIGGQMAGVKTSAYDPVFFLHHTFVDYIWEKFRTRQKSKQCNVTPWDDYPNTTNVYHQSGNRMDGYPMYENKDGYQEYWTQTWYKYEDSPTCSTNQTFCGDTPYLRCNVRSAKCISIKRQAHANVQREEQRVGFAENAAPSIDTANKARKEANTSNVGLVFKEPPSENRTQDTMAMMSVV